jgi:hypothetical protein
VLYPIGMPIMMEIAKKLAYHWLVGTPVVVIDAPLLFESKRLAMICSRVIVVASDEDVQIQVSRFGTPPTPLWWMDGWMDENILDMTTPIHPIDSIRFNAIQFSSIQFDSSAQQRQQHTFKRSTTQLHSFLNQSINHSIK